MDLPDVQTIIVLDSLPCVAGSPCAYEASSDALIWSDEMPPGVNIPLIRFMRYCFRYRTSIIVGDPMSEYAVYWKYLMKYAPNWPGFHQDRRAVSYADTYRRLKAEFYSANKSLFQ